MLKQLLFIVTLFFTSAFSYSESEVWKNYQAILNRSTTSLKFTAKYGNFTQTAVDYEKLSTDPMLQKLIEEQKATLKATDLPIRQDEAKIFWINAYNFFTLVDMSSEWPVNSMKDIGWTQDHHEVGGKIYSLDQIEHQILRPMRDPRVHFAINCASVGCPSLNKSVYTFRDSEKQLDEAVKNALKNPLHLVVTPKNNVIATKLFDWFEDDWGGAEGVAQFVSKYGPVQTQEVGDFSYDWRANTKDNFREKYRELQGDYPHLNIVVSQD